MRRPTGQPVLKLFVESLVFTRGFLCHFKQISIKRVVSSTKMRYSSDGCFLVQTGTTFAMIIVGDLHGAIWQYILLAILFHDRICRNH